MANDNNRGSVRRVFQQAQNSIDEANLAWLVDGDYDSAHTDLTQAAALINALLEDLEEKQINEALGVGSGDA
jgi:hypothetical protein